MVKLCAVVSILQHWDCVRSPVGNNYSSSYWSDGGAMWRTFITGIAGATTAMLLSTPLSARAAPETGTPQSIQQLIACRGLSNPTQRLACYDSQTDGLRRAIATKDVVVIDKQRATATKRKLFGFSIPEFGGLFGGNETDVSEISSSITKVAKDPGGAWVVSLADGSTWTQTDDEPLGLPPERGDKVVVHRGSFGAFFLRINSQPGIKVKRTG